MEYIYVQAVIIAVFVVLKTAHYFFLKNFATNSPSRILISDKDKAKEFLKKSDLVSRTSSNQHLHSTFGISNPFTNSNIPAALELGFTLEDLFVIKYSDFGADMYGLALVTTKKFADENPQTMRGVVSALNQGTKDTIASPQKALELLKRNDPMMKLDIEKVRLDIALGLTNTQHVMKNGLSSVTPEKLKKTIDAMVAAYQLRVSPDPATVYTDQYLPPVAERMPPKSIN